MENSILENSKVSPLTTNFILQQISLFSKHLFNTYCIDNVEWTLWKDIKFTFYLSNQETKWNKNQKKRAKVCLHFRLNKGPTHNPTTTHDSNSTELEGWGGDINEGVASDFFLKMRWCTSGLEEWTRERPEAQRQECTCWVWMTTVFHPSVWKLPEKFLNTTRHCYC